MSLPQLSLAAARNLHLAAQGLLKKSRRRAQPADILSTVPVSYTHLTLPTN